MERQTALTLTLRSLELDLMPSWTTLKKDTQDKLRQFAGEVKQAQWAQGFANLKEAAALYQAKKLLQGEGQFREFLDKVYQGSWRTGYDRLVLYDQARQKLSEEQLAYVIAYGPGMMTYRNVPIGEFFNAAKGLPAPKSDKPEDMNPFIAKVDARFKEMKSERRKSGQKKIDADLAAKILFNTVIHYFSRAGIRTAQKQKELLERVVGMVLADRGIAGRLSVVQSKVPEGFRIKRGRPPKKKPNGHVPPPPPDGFPKAARGLYPTPSRANGASQPAPPALG